MIVSVCVSLPAVVASSSPSPTAIGLMFLEFGDVSDTSLPLALPLPLPLLWGVLAVPGWRIVV